MRIPESAPCNTTNVSQRASPFTPTFDVLYLIDSSRPSVPLQGAIIEAYQPIFRKDEETAWTIIQTRKTTKMKSCHSSISSDINSSVGTDPSPESAPKCFAFDNELFLGPVYKRLLLAKLCGSKNKENGSKSTGARSSGPEISESQSTNDFETRDHDVSETALEGTPIPCGRTASSVGAVQTIY